MIKLGTRRHYSSSKFLITAFTFKVITKKTKKLYNKYGQLKDGARKRYAREKKRKEMQPIRKKAFKSKRAEKKGATPTKVILDDNNS